MKPNEFSKTEESRTKSGHKSISERTFRKIRLRHFANRGRRTELHSRCPKREFWPVLRYQTATSASRILRSHRRSRQCRRMDPAEHGKTLPHRQFCSPRSSAADNVVRAVHALFGHRRCRNARAARERYRVRPPTGKTHPAKHRRKFRRPAATTEIRSPPRALSATNVISAPPSH